MKLYTVLGGLTLSLFLMITVSSAQPRYLEIKKPFVSVYEYLDPQSTILVQASKNDHFELVYEGTSWYQVKVKDKVGWVEKEAGIVVDNPGSTLFSIPIGTLLFFVFLLLATITGASFLIYKQKTAEL